MQLAFQEASRELGFFRYASRSEDIDITQFLFGAGEVAHFDQALLCQGLQAKIHPAEADTQFRGDLALAGLRIVFKHAHDTQLEFIAGVGC